MIDRRCQLLAGTLTLLLAGCSAPGDHSEVAKPTAQAATPAKPATPKPTDFQVGLCLDQHCAVLDRDARQIVPFDNDFDDFTSYVMSGHIAVKKGDHWQLLDAATGRSTRELPADIYGAIPGYYSFGRDGKVGLMDDEGNEVQAARFDAVFAGGKDEYIGYTLGGKDGVMDVHGKLLTEAVYHNLIVRDDLASHGDLVTGDRGKEHWVVSLKDGSQKKVPYTRLEEMHDDHMVASDIEESLNGLVDAQGQIVVDMKYAWLGTPSNGLVAFKEKPDQDCGYLDYTGKVVIPAQLATCQPFGKKGAMAQGKKAAEGGEAKFGLIGRDGAWIVQPTYDYADNAGRSLLGMLGHVPGYASIARLVDGQALVGIYDVDQGREVIPARYHEIGIITPERFVFGGGDTPTSVKLLGDTTSVDALGVMDRSGKVLIKPERFVEFRLDDTGRYLVASDGDEVPHQALYDPDGNQLIAPTWEELKIDTKHNIVLGYQVDGNGDDAAHVLRAVYDLDGKTLFAVTTTSCGADQVVDATGKPIWPQDATPYCQKDSAPATP